MKLQVQSIKPLASFFFLIPYDLRISVPLSDFHIKIRIMSKIRINTDFSVPLATLPYNIFNHELGKGCFIIEQVFRKKQYFWRKLRKTHLWEDMTILRGGGYQATKINITFL